MFFERNIKREQHYRSMIEYSSIRPLKKAMFTYAKKENKLRLSRTLNTRTTTTKKKY